MKKYRFLLALSIISIATGCDEDPEYNSQFVEPPYRKQDLNVNSVDMQVKDFMWRGLNEFYIWQEEVELLSDNAFGGNQTMENAKYVEFLRSYKTPDDLFYALLSPKDRFSFFSKDYEELEKSFQGVEKTTGMNFIIYKFSDVDKLYALVRYVVPGSPAEKAGIKRGDFITRVDGADLTEQSYSELLFGDKAVSKYEISVLEITQERPNGFLKPDRQVDVEKIEMEENPILIHKVIELETGVKVAYLMYNSFIGTPKANRELNQVFAEFKNAGVSEMVLDLRYNGGGSVETSTYLASMINGKHTGDVFVIQKSNKKMVEYFNSPRHINLTNEMTIREGETEAKEPINSIDINRLYVLTTNGTASASELIINGLKPYMEIIQIGEKTRGKNTASITLYDEKQDADGKWVLNPNHKWVMQPLVILSSNKDGFGEYENGIAPTYELFEDDSKMGKLSDMEEPFLKYALDLIRGVAPSAGQPNTGGGLKAGQRKIQLDNSTNHTLRKDNMYLNPGILKK